MHCFRHSQRPLSAVFATAKPRVYDMFAALQHKTFAPALPQRNITQSKYQSAAFAPQKTAPSGAVWIRHSKREAACVYPEIKSINKDCEIVDLSTLAALFLDRDCCGRFHSVQHKAGFAVRHTGVLEQGFHDETAVVLHICHHTRNR